MRYALGFALFAAGSGGALHLARCERRVDPGMVFVAAVGAVALCGAGR